MGLGLVMGVQLARGLGVEGYGTYGWAMSIVALLAVPTEFGLAPIVTREVASANVSKNWSRLRGITIWSNRAILLTSTAVTAVGLVVLLIATPASSGTTTASTLLVGLLLVPVVAFGKLRGAILSGLQHIVKGQLGDTFIRPAAFCALLFVSSLSGIHLTPSLSMAFGVTAASISFSVSYLLARRRTPVGASIATPHIVGREWLRAAVPMTLAESMRVLQGHLVVLLLGFMVSAAFSTSFLRFFQ